MFRCSTLYNESEYSEKFDLTGLRQNRFYCFQTQKLDYIETKGYQFKKLLLLNSCSFVGRAKNNIKGILPKIGFIKEVKTAPGTEEVLKIFFHNSYCSRKYDLIRWTP